MLLLFALLQVTVAADGSGDFRSVQAAVEAAPESGVAIRIHPGIYKEKLVISKPHIALVGLGTEPGQVVLSYDDSSASAGGTGKSASTTVSGDDFQAENLTFENTFSRARPLTHQGSQAVAMRVKGDRAVFRHVRFLGYQDTLYADGAGKRQYFADCYIEGNVDFIFGNARAYFERCEIHSLAHAKVMITAQSRLTGDEKSGFVFGHCRLTAEPGAKEVYLGRPWRSHAMVVFLNTWMGPEIAPAGWAEWLHDGQPFLPTVFYAEYESSGPGANAKARDAHSKQLTGAEAARFKVSEFFDGWVPK